MPISHISCQTKDNDFVAVYVRMLTGVGLAGCMVVYGDDVMVVKKKKVKSS